MFEEYPFRVVGGSIDGVSFRIGVTWDLSYKVSWRFLNKNYI